MTTPVPQPPHETDQLGDLFERSRVKRNVVVRTLLFVVGGALVVYGILGIVLPILPGFPFLIVGMPLLAASNERSRGWVNALDRQLPLTLRLLFRRFKLSPPPKDATPDERKRWRHALYLTLVMWLGCALLFGGIALLTRWLWLTYVSPLL